MDTSKKIILKIPKEVSHIINTLENKGFKAYLVGGCVRDLLMDREPKDWDITTGAKPDQIIELFKKTVYENVFGTVAVINEDVSCETLRQIEVTPYRIEAKYSDFRHPDKVKFSDNLEDDLKRRDFTINAMACRNGQALQLGFSVSYESSESILRNSNLIKKISSERIRDELSKIIMSPNPSIGMVMLQKFGLLKNIIPELEEGIGCEQAGEHIYDVWEHLLHALQHSAEKNWSLEVRLAALFHDIGKPKTRRLASPDTFAQVLGSPVRDSKNEQAQPDHSQKHTGSAKKRFTFYGHEVISARMAKKIMERLKFSRKEIDLVEKLVRNHMFFSDTELITLSAVRRIVTKVGVENIWLLMNVRECDRVGMKKKETPYRLRKYFAMIEEALHSPISVGQLKIDGEFMIKKLNIKPGPRMGWILHALLEEVLDDPTKNEEKHLSELVRSLNLLPDGALKVLGDRGKEKKEELEEQEIEKLHLKHGVR
ncbi:MAG: hypothetical protein UR92_C0034G0012 [Candidatus Nomurabacteria bacterium GW2011_GWA2_35_80]|uniref:HD/PDEase domain-containing protein n=1 Tax=Candidatus Nomurabacteria bacterium GW2011_GWA2_35_80 TaxID=1618733 RepID=A0A0G0DFN6_9BACT|nr:MAG: hypothetical protein UR92_C0034G0012 [Candidatus Nomurabacteria bacterium GW2011_GWA2_35_80]